MDESSFQKEIEEYKRLSALARKILGVREGADRNEIKKAYWKLAMKYHPDRFGGDVNAESENRARFENIQAAYDFLVKGKSWDPDVRFSDNGSSIRNKGGKDKNSKYKTDSKWGYFLWWRDRFF